MNRIMYIMGLVPLILGAINLGIYAWGGSQPDNLAVGIFCMAIALWVRPEVRYE